MMCRECDGRRFKIQVIDGKRLSRIFDDDDDLKSKILWLQF